MKPAAIRSKVEAFFRRYAATYARAPADKPGVEKAVTDAFADDFVESGRHPWREERTGLPLHGQARVLALRKIGVQSMEIARLDVVPLKDGQHAMAQVTWDSRTLRKSDERGVRIVSELTYFLTLAGGKPRIFAHVATDEAAILKRHGLI